MKKKNEIEKWEKYTFHEHEYWFWNSLDDFYLIYFDFFPRPYFDEILEKWQMSKYSENFPEFMKFYDC